ncbi:ileal sodium/bile acid cotransporter-like [Diadema antillarum]|uniref:ileal sodium/bile acid cotransporter-like n=1 Tax=Diadema antillarum TaxID=105358 RepID=UPI003A8515DF
MDMVTDFMNATTEAARGPPKPSAYVQRLKLANQVVLGITFFIVLIAMGASVVLKDFKIVLRRPVGVVVGFISQFVILPLLAYGYARVTNLDGPIALGCLILACSPGGSLSNLYTFWTNGDVCLSITMTTLSTLLAIGMMPLNLLIYSRRWTAAGTPIPYLDIFISLVLIVVPVGIGMVLRRLKERWAMVIIKPCSLVGFIGIICSIAIISVMNPRLYSSHWTIWIGAMALSWCGFAAGYLLSLLCRQSHSQCRTVGFETGVQNVGLCYAIISFAFKGTPLFIRMLTFPALFGPLSIFMGFGITAIYKLYERCHPHDNEKEEKDEKIVSDEDAV